MAIGTRTNASDKMLHATTDSWTWRMQRCRRPELAGCSCASRDSDMMDTGGETVGTATKGNTSTAAAAAASVHVAVSAPGASAQTATPPRRATQRAQGTHYQDAYPADMLSHTPTQPEGGHAGRHYYALTAAGRRLIGSDRTWPAHLCLTACSRCQRAGLNDVPCGGGIVQLVSVNLHSRAAPSQNTSTLNPRRRSKQCRTAQQRGGAEHATPTSSHFNMRAMVHHGAPTT